MHTDIQQATTNGLQIQEVGDFEALNCIPAQNLIRSLQIHLTTEPPISCSCYFGLFFYCSSKKSSSTCFIS